MDDFKQPPGRILDMEASGDEGEIIYMSKKPAAPWKAVLSAWLVRITGIALGVGIFLLLIFMFVYVVVPLVLIFAVYLFVRGLLARR